MFGTAACTPLPRARLACSDSDAVIAYARVTRNRFACWTLHRQGAQGGGHQAAADANEHLLPRLKHHLAPSTHARGHRLALCLSHAPRKVAGSSAGRCCPQTLVHAHTPMAVTAFLPKHAATTSLYVLLTLPSASAQKAGSWSVGRKHCKTPYLFLQISVKDVPFLPPDPCPSVPMM